MGRRTLLLLASILVAAVGTALIWIYVQSADSRARSEWKQTRLVLRATAAIDAGASALTIQQATELVAVPAKLVPARALGDLRAVAGRTPSMPILPGQFLQDDQFDPIPSAVGVRKGMTAISVSVEDPNRVAGLLRPSTVIDVYYVDTGSARAKTGGGSATLLLQDIRVLAVGNTSVVRNAQGRPAQLGTQTGVAAAVVVLEVQPAAAPRVIMATTKGSLWFTLPGEGVHLPDGAGANGSELPVWNG